MVIFGNGVLLGVVGYGSLISAMRIGEVSAITPFRYTRLIFGLSIGYFIFNEHVGINRWYRMLFDSAIQRYRFISWQI